MELIKITRDIFYYFFHLVASFCLRLCG